MALRKASEASDFDRIDFDKLAKEGAAVVITHRGYGETKDYGQGDVTPVKARVIVLTGDEAGRVEEDALIFKAGIRIKLGEKGDDTCGRLGVYGARKAAGLNDEHDGDLELAEAALAKANGDGSAAKEEPAKKPAAKASKPAPPADEDEGDDSDPDF